MATVRFEDCAGPAMTVTAVTLADIQQTLAQLQEAAGTTAIGAGTAAGSTDTGFAADLAAATSSQSAAGLVDDLSTPGPRGTRRRVTRR